TEYSFKVKAYTRDVESVAQFGVASDAYNVSTLSTQVEMTTYSNTTTAIRVNWEEIAGVEGYRVYMLVNGSWVNKGTVYGSDTTTLRIDSLTAGEVYEFYVRAFLRNDEGTAIFQTPSEIMTTQTDLAAAKITSASETSDAIRLNWNEVNGATGYKIYIYENGSWKTYATLYEGDVLTYRMSGFKANTTYKFKVCAFSKETGSTVWGSESSVYSVTTDK
ncbi:MAG: fibronectin type III domain-containing protein, partial [Clostridia bacterium]